MPRAVLSPRARRNQENRAPDRPALVTAQSEVKTAAHCLGPGRTIPRRSRPGRGRYRAAGRRCPATAGPRHSGEAQMTVARLQGRCPGSPDVAAPGDGKPPPTSVGTRAPRRPCQDGGRQAVPCWLNAAERALPVRRPKSPAAADPRPGKHPPQTARFAGHGAATPRSGQAADKDGHGFGGTTGTDPSPS